ncbi:hypothetical protein SLA2020_011170 [Shorea laevis]
MYYSSDPNATANQSPSGPPHVAGYQPSAADIAESSTSQQLQSSSPNDYRQNALPPPPPNPLLHIPPPQPGKGNPWSSGLCGCFSNVPNCCMTFWCPCVTFGRIAEIVDRGSTSCGVSGAIYALISCLTGCGCIYSFFYRSKLRKQYVLEKSPCADCLVHFCCEPCALCQEYRQLKAHGFDMTLGWHGSMERQSPGVLVPPVVESDMRR